MVHQKIARQEPFQLITSDKEFNTNLYKFLQVNEISNFDYHVVSVMGAQSTGKSTLLNQLFGTGFTTMLENNRQQTTREKAPILVMDVEGLDGRERGENQDFERKSALFSLATSEVFIINMWEHQVGLYQGANLGLLRTVFEVNLSLLAVNEATKFKSNLVFVIRDHIGNTPLGSLTRVIMTDLEAIWSELRKPSFCKDSRIQDFFEIQFAALAHKILLQDKFNKDVAKLSNRFYNDDDPDYVFKQEYSRKIPADGFSKFTETIWSQIESNKDLDLPKQHELLAQFRCDEISESASILFDEIITPIEKVSKREILFENLGSRIKSAKSNALGHYDQESCHYDNQVVLKKRLVLHKNIDDRLKLLFVNQLAALSKLSIYKYKKFMKDFYGNDFADSSNKAIEQTRHYFIKEAERCIPPDSDWGYADQLESLCTNLKSVEKKYRSDHLISLSTSLASKVNKNWTSFHGIFMQAKENMWDEILDLFESDRDKLIKEYSNKLANFGCTEEEKPEHLLDFQKKTLKSFLRLIKKDLSVSSVLLCLQEKFETLFKYEKGIPCVWNNAQQMAEKYTSAHKQTLSLVSIMAKIQRKDGQNFDISILIDDENSQDQILETISPDLQHEIKTKFRSFSEILYMDTRRGMSSQLTRIPTWIYLVIAILGWNEFMAILRNPILLILLLLTAAAAFIIYTLNMESAFFKLVFTIYDHLRQHLQQKL